MPDWVKDESAWAKAKAQVQAEYPAASGDHFWRLVTAIYQRMRATSSPWPASRWILRLMPLAAYSRSLPWLNWRLKSTGDKARRKRAGSGRVTWRSVTVVTLPWGASFLERPCP